MCLDVLLEVEQIREVKIFSPHVYLYSTEYDVLQLSTKIGSIQEI